MRRTRTIENSSRYTVHYVWRADVDEEDLETLCGTAALQLFHSYTALLTRNKPKNWVDYVPTCPTCVLLGMVVMSEDEGHSSARATSEEE